MLGKVLELYCWVICDMINLTSAKLLMQRKAGIVFSAGPKGKKGRNQEIREDQAL